ncbi:MAG: bacteriohemerythrin [Betaproteobacteria bacterium]|nr:bacteriohemerythrin [Betaproteobacteria bacterium]
MTSTLFRQPNELIAEAVFERGLLPACILERGAIAHANTPFTELFGRGYALIGMAIEGLAAPAERERLAGALVSAANAPARVHVHFQARPPDGSELEAEANLVLAGRQSDEALVMSVVDVSERRQTAMVSQTSALRDPLTGIANRALFLDHLRLTLLQARRQGAIFGVLLAQLDGFRRIHDALGHEAGDELLKIAAARLTAAVREGDTVARVGGDEFGVIAPGLGRRENAALIANRLIKELAAPMNIQDNPVALDVSVGVATWPDNADDPDSLYLQADSAMHTSRRSGKNRYYLAEPSAIAAGDAYAPLLEWSDVHNAGIAVMDAQHKRLAELINDLGRALKAGEEGDKLALLSDQIASFARTRFATEEALMDERQYPDSERHKEAHRKLIEALLRLSVPSGRKGIVLAMHFFEGWLFRHIESDDRALALALARIGVA